MTPDFCKNCARYLENRGQCDMYDRCGKWRTWLRNEWAKIRKAAGIIRRNNEREDPKR